MTYSQAQMIIHNPDSYTRAERRAAAAMVLSNLKARPDDVTAAMFAV